jgi:hypothetical protein
LDPAEVVLRFLESIGRRSEAEFYLSLFRAQPKERFAAICVDANVARGASEAVVLDLRFLSALGLSPTVIVGLLTPTDAPAHAARLARRLVRENVRALILDAGDAALSERVAEQSRARRDPAGRLPRGSRIRRRHRFPVCPPRLAARLVEDPQVDLPPPTGRPAPEGRPARPGQHDHRFRVAGGVARSVAEGAGAAGAFAPPVVRARAPQAAGRRDGFSDVDGERLRALLQSSFGRPPREEFFRSSVDDLSLQLYLEDAYRGVAIVRSTALGGYLTKFAVEREAQGEGLGRDLWEAVAADHATLFWRARPANPIGAWYTRRCDGLVRLPEWTVYWRGLSPDRIPEAIEYALAQPVDIPPGEAADGVP